jgi:hypothetical protein
MLELLFDLSNHCLHTKGFIALSQTQKGNCHAYLNIQIAFGVCVFDGGAQLFYLTDGLVCCGRCPRLIKSFLRAGMKRRTDQQDNLRGS